MDRFLTTFIRYTLGLLCAFIPLACASTLQEATADRNSSQLAYAALDGPIRMPEVACQAVDTIDKLAECIWSTTIYKNDGPRRFGDLMARAVGREGTRRAPSCHKLMNEVSWSPWHGAWPKSKKRLDYYYPGQIRIDITNCEDARALVEAMAGLSVNWEGCPYSQDYSYDLLKVCLDNSLDLDWIERAEAARQRNRVILPPAIHEKYFAAADYGLSEPAHLKESIEDEIIQCIQTGSHYERVANIFVSLVSSHERTLDAANTLEQNLKKQVSCEDLLAYAAERGLVDEQAASQMAANTAERSRKPSEQRQPSSSSNQLVYESCNWTKSNDLRIVRWCECMRDKSAAVVALMGGTKLSMFHFLVGTPPRSPIEMAQFQLSLERNGASRSQILGGSVEAQAAVGKLIPACHQVSR